MKKIELLSADMDSLSIDNEQRKLSAEWSNGKSNESHMGDSSKKEGSKHSNIFSTPSSLDLEKSTSNSHKRQSYFFKDDPPKNNEPLRENEEDLNRIEEASSLLESINNSKADANDNDDHQNTSKVIETMKLSNDNKDLLQHETKFTNDLCLMKEDSAHSNKKNDESFVEEFAILKKESSDIKNDDGAMRREDSNDMKAELSLFMKDDAVKKETRRDENEGSIFKNSSSSNSSKGSYVFTLPREREENFCSKKERVGHSKVFKVTTSSKYKVMDTKLLHLLTMYNSWEDMKVFFSEPDWPIAYKRFLILNAKRGHSNTWCTKVTGCISILKAQAALLRNCLNIIDGPSQKHS